PGRVVPREVVVLLRSSRHVRIPGNVCPGSHAGYLTKETSRRISPAAAGQHPAGLQTPAAGYLSGDPHTTFRRGDRTHAGTPWPENLAAPARIRGLRGPAR